MKIRGITVRVPPLLFAVTVFFAAMCAMMYGSSKDAAYIYIGAPLCVILLCMPLAMNYITEKQLLNQMPGMKARAKFTRARQISPAMLGTPVVVEGKILKVSGILMGKPMYLVADSTGQIVVKRFAHPEPMVGVGATVEIIGTVARKITNADVVYVNAVSIRPIKQVHADTPEKPEDKSSVPDEKIHIKKLH